MSKPPILILRSRPVLPHFYDVILDWISSRHPALVPYFEVATLPHPVEDLSGRKLLVNWFQDPTDTWEPENYEPALQFGRVCSDSGIRQINRVDGQKNLSRLNTFARLSAAGISTPRVFAADDTQLQMSPPYLVREDVGHQTDIVLVKSLEEALQVPLSNFSRPVVAEFVDTKGVDGLYRKYRCFAIGDSVITHHLQISEEWLTRGSNRVKSLAAREEEIEYLISPDQFQATFQAARKALDMEILAFDYGIASDGNPVVWEANQYPLIHYSKSLLVYRSFAVDRTIAAIVHFYLTSSGIEPPDKLTRQASYEE